MNGLRTVHSSLCPFVVWMYLSSSTTERAETLEIYRELHGPKLENLLSEYMCLTYITQVVHEGGTKSFTTWITMMTPLCLYLQQ